MGEKGPREAISLNWHYRIEPSKPLPVLDLSQSLKSRYFADRTVHKVNRFLGEFKALFFYSYAISLLLSIAVPLVDVATGRIAAVLAAILCLPLGLGSLDIKSCDRCSAQTSSGSSSRDLRALRAVVDWINFVNVVFMDARLRGIRAFANLSVLRLVSSTVLAVLAGLNRIDETSGNALWYYGTSDDAHGISARSYVANGLGTLIILITKFLYRVRKSTRLQQTSNVVNCVVYRCRIKLVSCSMCVVPVGQPTPRLSIRRSPWIQQMVCVQEGDLYDVRKTLFPFQLDSRCPFGFPMLVFIYATGCTSLITLGVSIIDIRESPNHSSRAALSWVSLVCTCVFCGIFGALYQRDLLKDVMTSFDFIFNSIQLSIVHFVAAALDDWEPRYCLCLSVSWLWIHWALALDALTPVMRKKLLFHTKFAFPIVLLFALGCLFILANIYSGNNKIISNDLLWTGPMFGDRIEVHVLTFFTQRLESLLIWMVRMLLRLVLSSNQDATILRGTLAYSNYILNSARMGQDVQSAQRTKRSRRMSRSPRIFHRVQPAPKIIQT